MIAISRLFNAKNFLYLSCMGMIAIMLMIHRDDSQPSTTAVIYSYFESPNSAKNLRFFLEFGICRNIVYVIVIQGHNCSVPLPNIPSLHFVRRDNRGYDFAAYSAGIQFLMRFTGVFDALRLPFRAVVFLNSGVVGPFLPAYYPKGHSWTAAFTDRLSGAVKLVGTSLVCLPPSDLGGWGPRVEGMCFATDITGLSLMLQTGVFQDSREKHGPNGVIVAGEYAMSRILLDHGYNLDTLLFRYQGIDWRQKANWNCNGNIHPSRRGSNDGVDIQPLEVIFHKMHWVNDGHDSPVAEILTNKLMLWAEHRMLPYC